MAVVQFAALSAARRRPNQPPSGVDRGRHAPMAGKLLRRAERQGNPLHAPYPMAHPFTYTVHARLLRCAVTRRASGAVETSKNSFIPVAGCLLYSLAAAA